MMTRLFEKGTPTTTRNDGSSKIRQGGQQKFEFLTKFSKETLLITPITHSLPVAFYCIFPVDDPMMTPR